MTIYATSAIKNSEYWDHTRSHPGHENDSPPPPPRTSFGNGQQQQQQNKSRSSSDKGSTDAIRPQVGKEYEVDITQIGRRGDGIARIQGFVTFVKGGHIGEQVNITITKTGSRFAIATIA